MDCNSFITCFDHPDQSDNHAIAFGQGSGVPFFVYAVDAPVYTSRVYGLVGSDTHIGCVIPGSAILISGGLLRQSGDGSSYEVLLFGLIGATMDLRDLRFAERALARLASPDDRVALFYPKGKVTDTDWPKHAREAGFLVKETADAAVCAGPGRSLLLFNWLEGICSCCHFDMFALPTPESVVEAALMDAADRNDGDVWSVMRGFWDKISHDPCAGLEALGDAGMYACLADPEGSNVLVTRADTNISDIDSLFSDVASDLRVPLYFAGSLDEIDEAGHTFVEFANWLTWVPLPCRWKRIA